MFAVSSKTNFLALFIAYLFLFTPVVLAASSPASDGDIQAQEARELDENSWTLARSPDDGSSDPEDTFYKRVDMGAVTGAARNAARKLHGRAVAGADGSSGGDAHL